MTIDIINQLQKLVKVFGVGLLLLRTPYEQFEQMDAGIRRRIYEKADYGGMAELLGSSCMDKTLYFITDEFEVNYIIFKIPEYLRVTDQTEFTVIGPYITRDYEAILTGLTGKNGLSLYHLALLKEYYSGVSLIDSRELLESVVIVQAADLFREDGSVQVVRHNAEWV